MSAMSAMELEMLLDRIYEKGKEDGVKEYLEQQKKEADDGGQEDQ